MGDSRSRKRCAAVARELVAAGYIPHERLAASLDATES